MQVGIIGLGRMGMNMARRQGVGYLSRTKNAEL